MLTDVQAGRAWVSLQDCSQDQDILQDTPAIYREKTWRQVERGAEITDIVISRWQNSQITSRLAARRRLYMAP
jgi:hypothetical protein